MVTVWGSAMLLHEVVKDIDQEMGTHLPGWIKARNAKSRNDKFESRVPRESKETAEKIKRLIVSAYPRSRVYTNYLAKTISLKVNKPNVRDLNSGNVADLDTFLSDEYGIVPRSVGEVSIIYHIPYTPKGV